MEFLIAIFRKQLFHFKVERKSPLKNHVNHIQSTTYTIMNNQQKRK